MVRKLGVFYNFHDQSQEELEREERQRRKKYLTCEKKKAYPTSTIAVEKAKEATARSGDDIRAYHCEFCYNFHIGHFRKEFYGQAT